MKKLLILTLAVILTVGIASYALADGLAAGIAGSPHDFSNTVPDLTDSSGNKEICRICHSPHDHHVAAKFYMEGLLWNHGVTEATYTMYNSAWSSTIDGTVAASPIGISKLCLSCHDGTVAVDNFESHAGGAFALPTYAEIPGFAEGTTRDLRGTHPISIVYDDAADGWLMPANFGSLGGVGKIEEALETTAIGATMQCSTCHDVHDAAVEAIAGTPLLRVTIDGSALCLACHMK